jgi:hypothetical protein
MRSFISIICFFAVFQNAGCLKDTSVLNPESSETTPACISQKIEEIKSHPKGWGAAKISEYDYKNKKVYLFYMNCCDRFNPLYDSNCNYICSPSGGFSGGGDGLCTDFYSTAELVREVWKDPR